MSTTTERTASVSVEIGGRDITFETGKLAKQADGAVAIRSGDTLVLATAQGRLEAREGADFFPLTVDVEERMYAAGKIPGGFFKREARASEAATLAARLTDRPSALFPRASATRCRHRHRALGRHGRRARQFCINGISAALMPRRCPSRPVGAVRVGIIDGGSS